MLSVPLPLILFTLNELKFKINIKWLCFIGSISFELYLAHVIPMNFIQNYNIDIKSGLIVTIYEVDGTTVRTTIEYDNKIFGIDINNSNEIYISITCI